MATFFTSPGGSFQTSSPTSAPAAAPAAAPAPAAAVSVAAPASAPSWGTGFSRAREYELTPDIFASRCFDNREPFAPVSEEARRDFFLHTQPETVQFFIHPQPERIEVPVPIFVQVPVLHQQQGMSGLVLALAAVGVIVLIAAILLVTPRPR